MKKETSIRETTAFFNIPSYERIRVKMSSSYKEVTSVATVTIHVPLH
ncbi:hypothetical protein BC03BB108_C0165 (plasmid) [Bacillus cereus 03BB108]|nr:hypothetical protein BC03BB108_C0165 [Bacillus cereus 03BB108]